MSSTQTSSEDFVGAMASDLLDLCKTDIITMLAKPDTTAHYSVEVDMSSYSDKNDYMCNEIMQRPSYFLPLFDQALLKAQEHILTQSDIARHLSFKPNVHVRCIELPVSLAECHFSRVPRSSEIGRLISFVGTVIRTGMVKMLETKKYYDCGTCKTRFAMSYDREQYNQIPKPAKCGNIIPCDGKKFKEVPVEAGEVPQSCKDYQEIKVQEQVTRLALGTIPRSITVVLEDDLADICKAGDDIKVIGTVTRRWRSLMAADRPDIDIVIVANHVKVNNEHRTNTLLSDELIAEFEAFWAHHQTTPLTGRDLVLKSFCPKIVGMYLVKLAVMMLLVGGVAKYDQSGMKMRGDGHMLLVGDPGIGKSQFMRYAARVSPRSVLTTGIGSTSAGLTVTAVKDSGEWQLEAGALVLADQGLCCIDEFGSIREHDKTAIHEAMEQQTISVAKAGLVCKLNTRCSILAATNPKGKYDPNQSLEVNIALASPLLSRFDLVLTLLDSQNEAWDRNPEDKRDSDMSWNLEKMQAYVAYVKANFDPDLTENANLILKRYYQLQRASDLRNAARTTIRLLESLVRLSQSHARLMCQKEVTVRDAVAAVMLMEISMQTAGVAELQSALHFDFPEDSEREYLRQEKKILAKLGLSNLATQGFGSDGPNGAEMYSQASHGRTRISGDNDDDDDGEEISLSWPSTQY
ncbi:DNA helicase mcm9 [Blyttiomyces sp. JEL0837]|nr:DNA helicase mcm9 [Blyttiomyces sp. JEL0837]